MKYRLVLVALGILAIASAVVFRQRTGNSSATETPGSPQTVPLIGDATDTLLVQPSETDSLGVDTSAQTVPIKPNDDLQARQLLALVSAAYTSTVNAFDPSGDESSDFDERDAKAAEDAQALQRTFEFAQNTLPAPLQVVCHELVEHVTAAQLQIMAFAINRKNRGFPDSVQAEAEGEDRKQFKRDVEPLYKQLITALG